jgi:hypothetical protein
MKYQFKRHTQEVSQWDFLNLWPDHFYAIHVINGEAALFCVGEANKRNKMHSLLGKNPVLFGTHYHKLNETTPLAIKLHLPEDYFTNTWKYENTTWGKWFLHGEELINKIRR